MIKGGKLEDRDGARMISSIPYHIRFPTKTLVDEMGGLLDMVPSMSLEKRFTKMAIPSKVLNASTIPLFKCYGTFGSFPRRSLEIPKRY